MDLNTFFRRYLCDLYTLPASSDVTALVRRYLDSQSGEMTARMRTLIANATDFAL